MSERGRRIGVMTTRILTAIAIALLVAAVAYMITMAALTLYLYHVAGIDGVKLFFYQFAELLLNDETTSAAGITTSITTMSTVGT